MSFVSQARVSRSITSRMSASTSTDGHFHAGVRRVQACANRGDSGDIREHWPKRPFDLRTGSLSSEHNSYRGDVATAHVPQERRDEAGSATYRHPRSWTVRFLVGGAAATAALAVLVLFAF